MRTIRIALIMMAVVAVFARSEMAQQGYKQPQLHPKETHLRNIKQLTFGGENAEDF